MSVSFVNSVETCHFRDFAGMNALDPFLKLSEMSATDLYLEVKIVTRVLFLTLADKKLTIQPRLANPTPSLKYKEWIFQF